MRNLVGIFFLSLCFQLCLAQSPVSIWYFGENAGVDFSTGTPVAITDGQLNTDEGCVTIANEKGKLQFYTDGVSVWNKYHKLMPNGTGLLGSPSSTSSGVVIKHPGAKDIFYLFTVAETGSPNGFRYSMVDMKLDSGRGDVIADKKNILLRTPVTEKLTAALHRNGKDYWILLHDWQTNVFVSYLITAEGLQSDPILSETGSVHTGGTINTQGYLKVNPDGTNLALALEESQVVEMFDFDNATGKVSNPISVTMAANSYPYGIEFSPSGSLMYVTAAGTGEIFQYNLQAGSEQAIRESVVKIGQTADKTWVGALQVAADGKIYFTVYKKPFLGVISNPNAVGIECGFDEKAVDLIGHNARLGLPTFSQNFFYRKENKKVEYFNEANVVKGRALVLKNILFDFDKATLKASSFTELDKVVRAMKADPTLKVKVSGHTDNIGNKSYNIDLSKNRAKSVGQYLISKGIPTASITHTGYGSSLPVAGNDTEQGRSSNRRVELEFE